MEIFCVELNDYCVTGKKPLCDLLKSISTAPFANVSFWIYNHREGRIAFDVHASIEVTFLHLYEMMFMNDTFRVDVVYCFVF